MVLGGGIHCTCRDGVIRYSRVDVAGGRFYDRFCASELLVMVMPSHSRRD